MATISAGDDSYVGVPMVELPPDRWLPEGYTLRPTGGVAIDVTGPDGHIGYACTDPAFRAAASAARDNQRRRSTRTRAGPAQGLDPQTRASATRPGRSTNDTAVQRNRNGQLPGILARGGFVED